MRTIIADLIGMPEADLGVIAPDVGGGFGQKMSLAAEYVVVTWLARKLKTSVAWVEDRRENLVACFHSRDQSIALEGAFDADAKVIGFAADIVADVGAYSCYPTTCALEPLSASQAKARAEGRYLGFGMATFSECSGYGTQASAARGMEVTPGWETVEMTMDPSGFVEARIGASPHGQGLRTTLSQIIADELGTSPERIKIVHGDTDRTPYGWGTFASRSLVIAGGATLLAARKIRAKLTQMAGILLEASADDIVLEADAARVARTDRSIPVTTLAPAAYHHTHPLKTRG